MNNVKRGYVGFWVLFFLFVLSFCVPKFSNYRFSDQNLEAINIPPIVKLRKISDYYSVYIHQDLYPVLFDNVGNFKGLLNKVNFVNVDIDNVSNCDFYLLDGKYLIFDYSQVDDFKAINYDKIKVTYNGKVFTQLAAKMVWNKSNILGTDQLGRDLLIRVFQGIKTSLIIGLIASVVNLIIGVLYGSLSGYIGGKIDVVMLSFLNVISSIPAILLVVLLSLFIAQSLWSVIVVIGAVYWVSMARQVRAGVMALKQREFVWAEVVLGTPHYKIIFKHIMPNLKGTILTTLIVNIQNAIFTESLLSFLGIGVLPPTASLGILISDSIDHFKSCPYQLIIPSAIMVLILVCLEQMIDNKTQ